MTLLSPLGYPAPVAGGPIAKVREVALRHLTVDDRREVELLTLLHDGRARAIVRKYLADLGAGMAADIYPLQVGLLRHVVDQLSVLYRSPPTRHLVRGRIRVGDGDTAQRILWRQYERSRVDAVLREVDLRRSLWRTAFVRLYASDVSRRVKLSIYPPTAVHRDPDPGEPDELRADRRIAVERSDGYELFEAVDAGWRLTMYDLRGVAQGPPETLDVLPLVAFYDGHPSQAYIPPYQWRSEYAMKLALIANEIPTSALYNVHPRSTLERNYPPPGVGDVEKATDPPTDIGPGTLAVLEDGERMVIHETSPKIAEISSALRELVEEWFRAESLPTDSFRRSQSVSALGLRVLEQPLRERRERLAPHAREAEERLFDAFRALHNAHAERWNQPWLADGRDLDLVLGDLDVPADPREHLDVLAREMSLGLQSRLGALQAYRGLNRREALDELLQADEDRRAFLLDQPANARAETTGTRPAAPPEEQPRDGASMVQLAARAQR